MSLNLELFLNDLPTNISEKQGIYEYFKLYAVEPFNKFNKEQTKFILDKYKDPLKLEKALKIMINLPKSLSFKNLIKSTDYNLNFREKFKELNLRKDFKIKVSSYNSPHNFFNGTQYDMYFKNEVIGNFNFIFTYEKNNLTLRLKYMQGVKGKGSQLSSLSSRLNQDWMSRLLIFLKKYSEAKKINYVFEIPPKYTTANEKVYRKYAFENYLKRYLDNNIPISKIDFKNVPKEYLPEIKEIINSRKPKKTIPRLLLKTKRNLRKFQKK
ncbi:hypothetical protein GW835_02235 [archaeon]|nr:hypothetical protein [archaeon]NCP79365.1 hypothetical protein [archaeon]NCP97308.1 hypothetical protein [archaeon]NCQ07132.1 hypothetical protein [archaeon]NCQ50928.1 hypothetical protein [archaeon]